MEEIFITTGVKNMMELRHNPITDEWIIVSSETQKRPVLPKKEACPLCPGILEMKHDYDLTAFDNRYPALRLDPPEILKMENQFFENAPSYGKCEVIMFTSDHNSSLSRMPIVQIEKLIYVWEDRTRDLMKYEKIKYIFPFENRGKEVGASQIHPHGQLYAFPFIPKRIQVMIDAKEKYKRSKHGCVICDIVKAESKSDDVVYENEHFIALVPYFARFPYEVHVYSKRHLSFFTQMTSEEKFDLAVMLKVITSKYDALFDQEFPYMMEIFQAPVNPIMEDFHFHIEFNPPKRDRVNVKWMASVETGTWAFIDPLTPSDAAKALKEAPYTI
jgi:UDPglucose--hexose-1-phosphate uridylyltransferase